MFDNKPHHGHPTYHRRLLCEALETRTLLSVGLAQASSPAQQQTLSDLPMTAQSAISADIGRDQADYHVATGAKRLFTLANPANGFTAQLQSGALQVSAGSDTWDMSLVKLGYGGAMQPVGTAQTSVNGNRVDANYGTIGEWYVNGPEGLEQGFTLVPQPQSNASGSLTVELALGGDLVGTVNSVGDGLTLTRPDGSTALGYTGLTACDATGKTLPASLEVQMENGHQDLLIHVNDAGAKGPITIDPFVQEAKLTASDGTVGDQFGRSVSISGNTLVVGAPAANNFLGNSPGGAAYVFTESGSVWTQTAELTASDGAWDNGFGISVSISGGNTVVVGASRATVGDNSEQGAVYVFTESGFGWTQTAKLTASDGAAGNEFGYSVSISGNTVVVGRSSFYPADAGNSAAYVFTEPTSGWKNMTQTAELTDGAAKDYFGISVSISGDTVVVGADYATVGGNIGQGAAYVFAESGSSWTQAAELTASDGAAGDNFGWSVSISGNTVVAAARNATVGGNSFQGAAYVFTESGSSWTQAAKLTASDGAADDLFGTAVAISGNTVVVGVRNATVGGIVQGAAYVFATPTPLTVPATDWTSAGLTLTLGGDGNLYVYTGTTNDVVTSYPLASVSNIEITSPSDTTANLTIDSTNGDPIPAGGLTYSGAGGLIITGSGSVTLSGTNTYTGGTTVAAGKLLVNSAVALPDGTSLTVGAGGTFIFDRSQSASSALPGGVAVPATGTSVGSGISTPIVAAGMLADGPVAASAPLATTLGNTVQQVAAATTPSSTHFRADAPATVAAKSSVASDAVFKLYRSPIGRAIEPADNEQSSRAWAWLVAIESSWNSSDPRKTTDSNAEALDKVLARFGV